MYCQIARLITRARATFGRLCGIYGNRKLSMSSTMPAAWSCLAGAYLGQALEGVGPNLRGAKRRWPVTQPWTNWDLAAVRSRRWSAPMVTSRWRTIRPVVDLVARMLGELDDEPVGEGPVQPRGSKIDQPTCKTRALIG